jgi:hypothetical protein
MEVNAFRFDFDTDEDGEPELHEATPLGVDDLLAYHGAPAVHPYESTGAFTEGEFIEHPTFGTGYVLAVLWPPTKMEVLFSDGKRIITRAGRSDP